ncbi:deoxyhypusine synthase family protein [Candidatus Pelagibacter bacterium]|nr:deoxyhypusine synthase family protein [Candidatus Pelagibacter bacterium]
MHLYFFEISFLKSSDFPSGYLSNFKLLSEIIFIALGLIPKADSRDGACSSSTLKEASSWGKVDITKEQMVFAEATSVLPLIASDAYHRAEWKNRDRKNFTKIFE